MIAEAASSEELAKRIRIHSLKMTSAGGGSHIGSCLSVADILAVLYKRVLYFDPRVPRDKKRDRLVMSKGHAGAALYATLAESGFFPKSKLETHYRDGSDLCGHVSHDGIPGVEVSTGSLGHGLSIACGMALHGKRTSSAHKVICVMSDGECDEGSVWEAALFASHFKLNQLFAIIDYNKLQSLGPVAETLALEPLADKWRSFGWDAFEIDGHNHSQIEAALNGSTSDTKPTCIIAHTTKGKGVSFMENSVLWHYRVAKGSEYDAALDELSQGPYINSAEQSLPLQSFVRSSD